jgi:hypothetical protein
VARAFSVGKLTSHPLSYDTALTGEKIDDELRPRLTRLANLVRLLLRAPSAGWCAVLGIREMVIKFLQDHPGYVCAECLASSIGVPPHPTTMITLGLQRAEGFDTADDVCPRCHRLIRVIKAEGKT